MILERKKLFFRTIFLVFEDDKIEEVARSGRYSSIVAITRRQFPHLGLSYRLKKTAVIDLTRPEEEIFAGFRDTTRNEIRRTYNIPELSFIREDAQRKAIYGLYVSFEKSQGRVPFPEDNMKDALIFSAYYKGEPISAIYLDSGGKDLRLRYVFSKRLAVEDKEMYKRISFSTRRLIWEICQWGKEHGFHSLDMASVNFENPDVAGITAFKMSFGGQVADEYDYTYRSRLFKLFEQIARLRNVIKKKFI